MDCDRKLLTAADSQQCAIAQKEQLCVGKAEMGGSKGECFHSVQNNSWLPEQHWKASAFFFSYSPSLSRCYTNTQLCRNIWAIQVTVMHMEMLSDQMTSQSRCGRLPGFLYKTQTCLWTATVNQHCYCKSGFVTIINLNSYSV